MVTSVLQMCEVRKSYKGFVLGPISEEFGTGVTALLGSNGSGKSTLLRIAGGILRPDSGRVTAQSGRNGELETRVGYLPQDFAGPKRATVGDYMHFVAWCKGGRRQGFGPYEIREALSKVGLADMTGRSIGQLSGGMVRRLGIAQALLGHASTILLDEPTVGLDVLQRRELRELLLELGASTTVLVSTHLSGDVAAVAASVRVLHEGEVKYSGSTEHFCQGGPISGEQVERALVHLMTPSGYV